jgi:hypothetical protein
MKYLGVDICFCIFNFQTYDDYMLWLLFNRFCCHFNDMLVRNRNTQFCKVFTNSYLQCRRCYEYEQHTYNKVIKQWHHHLHLLPLNSIPKQLNFERNCFIERSNQKTMNNNLLILFVTKIHKYIDEHNNRQTNNK